MKLFGGSGGRKNRNGDSTPAQAPAQQAAPKPEGNHQPISAPKPGGKKGKAPKEKKKLTPAEIGTAHHLFMQFCDFDAACAPNGVENELNRLAEKKILSTEQAHAVE